MERVAITGLRVPITGLRVPIHLGEPLDWDEQFAKFENYIKFAAKQTFEGTPNSFYSSEDLYQEGLLLMWQCFEKYKYKPEKEFQYLFKSSLWRKLREKVNKPNLETDDIDGLYDSEDIGYTEDNLDDIFEEYRMKQVRELLSGNPTALVILEELVNPSEVTMNECDKDRNRKEMLKNQGKIIQLATTVEITGTHIQRALHLSEEVYKENFKLIQGAIYEVYSRDTDIKNKCTHTKGEGEGGRN